MRTTASLDQITTEWAILRDPGSFVTRYATAIQHYFKALIRNPHDAEEVAQDFLLRVVQVGFVRAQRKRGRFRDYLKAAVRNAARNFLQRHRAPAQSRFSLDQLAAPGGGGAAADAEWLASWRRCLLDRAWSALEKHQRRSPDNLAHTVLRLTVRHAGEDSTQLAHRTATLIGRPMRPEAFRKQLSRARRVFADLLVDEVAQTLDDPTPARVEEELSEVNLLRYVRDFLPADWHSRSQFTRRS